MSDTHGNGSIRNANEIFSLSKYSRFVSRSPHKCRNSVLRPTMTLNPQLPFDWIPTIVRIGSHAYKIVFDTLNIYACNTMFTIIILYYKCLNKHITKNAYNKGYYT